MTPLRWIHPLCVLSAICLLVSSLQASSQSSPKHAGEPTRFTVVTEGAAGGPAVLLLPGLSSSRAVFDAEAALLTPSYMSAPVSGGWAVSPINMSGVHSSRLMAVPKLLLLCVVLLDIPFQVSIHAARQEAIEELGAISGFEISLGSIALALLCLIVVIGPGFTRPRAFDKTVVTPAFLLLVIYVFSVLVAKDSLVALFEVWKVAGLFCLCWYVTHTVASREDFLFVVRWLLLGLIFESVLMLGQAGGWVGSFTLWGLKVRDDFLGSGRICGSLASPNEAAPYLAMIMTLALSVLRAKVRRSDKFLAAAGLSVAIIPLIATGSRGGWLAFVVGAIIVVLFGGKRHRIRTAAALIVMLLAIGAPLANVLQDRLTRDDSGSAASRVPLNRIALLMIADYPILGVGANTFPLVMAPYAVRCHAMGELQ